MSDRLPLLGAGSSSWSIDIESDDEGDGGAGSSSPVPLGGEEDGHLSRASSPLLGADVSSLSLENASGRSTGSSTYLSVSSGGGSPVVRRRVQANNPFATSSTQLPGSQQGGLSSLVPPPTGRSHLPIIFPASTSPARPTFIRIDGQMVGGAVGGEERSRSSSTASTSLVPLQDVARARFDVLAFLGSLGESVDGVEEGEGEEALVALTLADAELLRLLRERFSDGSDSNVDLQRLGETLLGRSNSVLSLERRVTTLESTITPAPPSPNSRCYRLLRCLHYLMHSRQTCVRVLRTITWFFLLSIVLDWATYDFFKWLQDNGWGFLDILAWIRDGLSSFFNDLFDNGGGHH